MEGGVLRLDLAAWGIATASRDWPLTRPAQGLWEGTKRDILEPGHGGSRAPEYLSNAISKVGGRNRIDASRIARDAGWL